MAAFNPIKNKNSTPQEEPPIVSDNINDTLVTYEDSPLSMEGGTLTYEGEDISELQQVGLNTEDVLIEDETIEKPKFNLPVLDSLPLNIILESMNAEKVRNNLYKIYENEISIKENKWYNTTFKRGNVKALSLTKHLFTLKHKIPDIFISHDLKNEAISYLEEVKSNPSLFEEKVTPAPIVQPAKVQKKQITTEERFARYKLITEELNHIDLTYIMEDLGANPNEDGTAGKWKVHSTGDNIAITGQQWFSWKGQEGGVGGISLLAFHYATLHNIDLRLEENRKTFWTMARNELIKKFGIGDLADLANTNLAIIQKEPFALPYKIEGKINSVRNYLYGKRDIPMWIINKQIEAGFLYAGFPSDWKTDPKDIQKPDWEDERVWATFLSVNSTAAEMRGIARSDNLAKILAKGSDKNLGGFAIKAEKDVKEKSISALEAAVDTLSYHAIYPGRLATSCMGVSFKLAVKNAMAAIPRGYTFNLCFDNDQAGNESAIRFRENLIIALGEDSIADRDDIEELSDDKKYELIQAQGLEKYQELYLAGKVTYYELGLNCLEESVKSNKIFYLDTQETPVGMDVVKLFQAQANKRFGKDYVKELVLEGKLKYLNACPVFENLYDIEEGAKQVIDKLSSGKPYYLRIKLDDEDNQKSQNVQNQKKEDFKKAFERLAGDKIQLWVEQGIIIQEKVAIAKDWNEFLIYKKQNDPEFRKKLQEQEEQYSNYSGEKSEPKKNKMK